MELQNKISILEEKLFQKNVNPCTTPTPKPPSATHFIDIITDSNILYTSRGGNFPVLYQISVFSWLFIIKSDPYLNDLWSKIFTLRQHYERLYHHKETAELVTTCSTPAIKDEIDFNSPSLSEKSNLQKALERAYCPVKNVSLEQPGSTQEKTKLHVNFTRLDGPAHPVSSGESIPLKRKAQREDSCPVVGCDSHFVKKRKSAKVSSAAETLMFIERQLPGRKVIWLLIDRFFELLYSQLPYIDETSFRSKISRIVGSRTGSKKVTLSHMLREVDEDFLYLCLMLIVIRLSWLTLPINCPVSRNMPLSPEEKILIKPENTVSMSLMEAVKEVFTNIKLLSKPCIIILQTGIFLKYYNILSPEDGFDIDDSYNSTNGGTNDSGDESLNASSFLNMLISMAKIMGLHRDPLVFKNFSPEGAEVTLFRKRHLWRKLWYCLISLNIITNISLGDYAKSLMVELNDTHHKYWDCHLPGSVESEMIAKSFQGESFDRELLVIDQFDHEFKISSIIHHSMKILLNVQQSPSKEDVDQVIGELSAIATDSEETRHSKVGINVNALLVSFGDAKDKTRNGLLSRIFKLKLFLMVKTLLFVLNYIMLLNFEKKLQDDPGNLDFKFLVNTYFEKTLLLAIDNYNIFNLFFENCSSIFPNSGAELILYPFLMTSNHRSMQFLISLVLRLQRGCPYVAQALGVHGIDKEDLLKRLFGYIGVFLQKLDLLTKSYYYAWRLKKLIKFFYNVLVNSSKIFGIDYDNLEKHPVDHEPKKSVEHCPIFKDLDTNATPVLATQRNSPVSNPTTTFTESFKERVGNIMDSNQIAPDLANMEMVPDSLFEENFFTELTEFDSVFPSQILGAASMEQTGSMEHEIDFTHVDFGESPFEVKW